MLGRSLFGGAAQSFARALKCSGRRCGEGEEGEEEEEGMMGCRVGRCGV